jgi:hypothetical protein
VLHGSMLQGLRRWKLGGRQYVNPSHRVNQAEQQLRFRKGFGLFRNS